MLFPKKVKHRKWQNNRQSLEKRMRPDTRGLTVVLGDYGVKATTPARVRSNQIEAARKVISRTVGKTGKVFIRIFPDRPITKKAAEVPMGKGKGDPDHFVFDVRPERVLFEVRGVPEPVAREAMRKALAKLPLKGKFIRKSDTVTK